ncbi:MAG: tyrosine-protein phosphatase [Bacteroidales bacterium]|nr:tyrosine-protein phosphatase [Bacteroidales bacterium]
MKQKLIIEKMKSLFQKVNGLDAALLYGSFASNTATPNSDLDIKLLISSKFDKSEFSNLLRDSFDEKVLDIIEIKLRNKIVLYFVQLPKIEFAFCNDIAEINRDFSSLNQIDATRSILYKNDNYKINLESYLKDLIHNKKDIDLNIEIDNLINKFIYEFESCSALHRRSDGYRFYYFYNIALHAAIQIYYLSHGNSKYSYLPKYFHAEYLHAEEKETFYQLNASLFLPKANEKKRKLLDFFYKAVSMTALNVKLDNYKRICESFYERDYFWNFRDISLYNPTIKPGIVFRTATMTVLQDDSRLKSMLQKKNIKTILDLRADRELNEHPYSTEFLNTFNYIRTPFDPWNQPEWFKKDYHYGTNQEIAYRYFILGCKNEIKSIFETILYENNGATAMHCFAGKDRTGIVISLIHLLSGADYDIIKNDFLASEVDMKLHRLQLVLDEVEKAGGIVEYLISCGITNLQIKQFKKKLLYEN